ncbi:glucose-6-phosphate dehydrogenase [Hyphococcus sp. DH-69]|uniref:glucose-6-phosphate dehydrogenase n=1 Tax=Hyphococcus formosus TaxID=3143534 RepID=UPI00398B4EDE
MEEISSAAQFIPVDAFDIIIFGAAGDLSLRKIIPALFHRWRDSQIPDASRIVGVSRTEMDDEAFRKLVYDSYRKFNPNTEIAAEEWTRFSSLLHYRAVNAADAEADWSGLSALLEQRRDNLRVFYLALPPNIYGAVAANIDSAGLKAPDARIVLEKPIGKDLASARAINDGVGAVFAEKNIFRIDHYLGKETVQNLIVLRFMNSIFEPIWNANAIDHVEITVAESIGCEGRASYYDTAGALRDMVQNHLLQLLCLVAMEPPLNLNSDTVRDEKIKVLKALRPVKLRDIRNISVRGQYASGATDGEVVQSYEAELERGSNTETFVALKANLDNWRWKDVPFYLRTGKRMSGRHSEIVVQFKDVAHSLIKDGAPPPPTRMVIRLQPDEGVKLLLTTKDPGPGGMRLRYVPLNLSYADHFEARYPDAYERLLMAVVRGDLALFMRRDEVEAAWQWVDGILAAWEADETPVHKYPAGTDGPPQAAMLLDRDGREWWAGK